MGMKKAAAMEAMKAKTTSMKAMKAMKVMKAKRVSVIAKGKRARVSVFYGRKEKTQSGMTKASLVKSKTGKIVSKAASARAKKNWANSAQGLVRCCQAGPESPEPHRLRRCWRQVGNRQGALCQGQVPAQVKGDSREELLPTLGFKQSAPPSWVSRGETV